jgi:S1-C subfamily serine protease
MENKRSKIKILMFGCLLIILIFICIAITVFGSITIYNQVRNYEISDSENVENNKKIEDFSSSDLFEAESQLIDLVEATKPAVVTITVRSRGLFSQQEENLVGSGTGFFISEDGLLVTNEHVVCGARPSDLMIIASNSKTYTVESLETDSSQDVAFLRVRTLGDKVPFLKFANEKSELKVGQEVLAIGNPFGDNPGTVTRGIISGLNRNIQASGSCNGTRQSKDYEGVLQTDAAINSGNSGGPLLNLRGEVIGVNSATLRGANNISYTVPHTTVLRILDRYLRNNNRIISPFIGVSYQMVSPQRARMDNLRVGALVEEVLESGPAQRAGIKPGDIITKVGDKSVDFSLATTLNMHFEPGQRTKIEVFRKGDQSKDGTIITLDIEIGVRPND